MAARVTVQQYKDQRFNNKLKDVTILQMIEQASRIIDRLEGEGISDDVLADAELWTALYLGAVEDRRIQSERIDPATVAYEKTTYLERMQLILGSKFSLLGIDENNAAVKPAKIWVVSPSE